MISKIPFRVFLLGFVIAHLYGTLLTASENWPEIKKLGNGLYDFDGITIDLKNRKIEFPMICNQQSGLIEYGIVHENGKIHESLFRTKIRPQMIHASLLLLKAKAHDHYFEPSVENNSTKSNLHNQCLKIEIVWDANGTTKNVDLRDMYYNHNEQNQKPEEAIFLFTGSRMIEETFMAEHTGSILGVYVDPDAIINSIETNSDNDDLWLGRKSTMPPLENKVTCVLHLP
jgi:hypothetical protein